MRAAMQTKVEAKSVSTHFAPNHTGLLQRKCTDGECPERRKKRLMLQRRYTSEAEPSEVPPVVHEVLRSPGQPLDTATRAFIGSRFGHDFSKVQVHSDATPIPHSRLTIGQQGDHFEQEANRNTDSVLRVLASQTLPASESAFSGHGFGHYFSKVRVHADAQAAESARLVNALAYTVGQHIVFGAGRYVPGTNEGKRLLAHELTHVMQQTQVERSSSLIHLQRYEPSPVYMPAAPELAAGGAAAEAGSAGMEIAPAVAGVAMPLAIIAWTVYGIYNIVEAHKTGRSRSALLEFAWGYADMLTTLTQPCAEEELVDLLGIDWKANFKEAYKALQSADMYSMPSILDVIREAGKAAIAQAVEKYKKDKGQDAWENLSAELREKYGHRYIERQERFHTILGLQAWKGMPIGISLIEPKPSTKPLPAPESLEEECRRRRRKCIFGQYPIIWPLILPPPPQMNFVRVYDPGRDQELAEKLTAGKWIRARREELRGEELVPHHVVPLFLGGADAPSNVRLWNAGVHRKGHGCLRDQPQMIKPPPPLCPLPRDLLQHPDGTKYRLAGYKTC